MTDSIPAHFISSRTLIVMMQDRAIRKPITIWTIIAALLGSVAVDMRHGAAFDKMMKNRKEHYEPDELNPSWAGEWILHYSLDGVRFDRDQNNPKQKGDGTA